MLRINNGITDLNLCNNDLRETGVRELCSSVVENEKLRTIRLVNNAKMGTEVVSEYACVRAYVCVCVRARAHLRARQIDRQTDIQTEIFANRLLSCFGGQGTKALTALQKSMALTRKLRVYF